MIQRQIKVEAGFISVAGHIGGGVDLALIPSGAAIRHFLITPMEALMVAAALQDTIDGIGLPLTFSHGRIIQDVPELLDWTNGVLHEQAGAGDFLKAVASAAQRADHENFPILLPSLMCLLVKYPQYLEQERARR